MHRMTRVATASALVLLLAACSGTGLGTGSNETAPSVPAGSMSAEPSNAAMPSASAGDESAAGQRVDMTALAADPGSYAGQEITVLARVDSILVDGTAFLTSPSGSDEDQIAVVIRPDAQLDKEIVEGGVVWVDGTVVGFTADDLSSAGVDLSPDDLGGFSGEFVLVADAIRDPLTPAS